MRLSNSVLVRTAEAKLAAPSEPPPPLPTRCPGGCWLRGSSFPMRPAAMTAAGDAPAEELKRTPAKLRFRPSAASGRAHAGPDEPAMPAALSPAAPSPAGGGGAADTPPRINPPAPSESVSKSDLAVGRREGLAATWRTPGLMTEGSVIEGSIMEESVTEGLITEVISKEVLRVGGGGVALLGVTVSSDMAAMATVGGSEGTRRVISWGPITATVDCPCCH